MRFILVYVPMLSATYEINNDRIEFFGGWQFWQNKVTSTEATAPLTASVLNDNKQARFINALPKAGSDISQPCKWESVLRGKTFFSRAFTLFKLGGFNVAHDTNRMFKTNSGPFA